MCLTILDKTSLCCIRSVLYVLYVLKPAKRADFSLVIGRFVNFLMPGSTEARSKSSVLRRVAVTD